MNCPGFCTSARERVYIHLGAHSIYRQIGAPTGGFSDLFDGVLFVGVYHNCGTFSHGEA